jgi:hypothetical protein
MRFLHPHRVAPLVAACAVAGCTILNPDFDGSAGPADAGVVGAPRPDLSRSPRDLAPPPVPCTGERGCINDSLSGICVSGLLQPDRVCPQGSTCAGGRCQPPPISPDTPPIGESCTTDDECYFSPQTRDFACQPFVDDTGAIQMRCGGRIGNGSTAAPCLVDNDCKSGFCLSNDLCFRACASDGDCPRHGNVHYVCRSFTLDVEGVSAPVTSCTNP